MSKNYVSYRDFGAVGDGLTNDFFAMQAAHNYANENGLPVKADPSDTYLISNQEKDGEASSIVIKTNTDWCGATIIFDDTNLCWSPGEGKFNFNTDPIVIKSDYDSVLLPHEICEAINKRGGVKNNDLKKIDTGLGYPALLVVSSTDERIYIRYGVNANNGAPKREIIEVDAEGNIDPETPFLFDYEKIDYIRAYRLDIDPIIVENATFISRASKANLIDQYHSISSGIVIGRPNTTVKNLYHKITGEIDKYAIVDKDSNVLAGYTYDKDSAKVFDPEGREVADGHAKPFIGHSYGAFVKATNTSNVTIENVTFQSRIYYLQGTYDLGAGMTNKILFKNCDQSNFFANSIPEKPRFPAMGKWWGVGGTNGCKNMTYDGCRLTRYDAHSSLVNGKILNSEIAAIRITGAGDMLIENTKIYGYAGIFVSLRDDYGATWQGTITIKDCEVYDVNNDSRFSEIITGASANHWFGYPCYVPNVIIDNLKIENVKPTVHLFRDEKSDPTRIGHYFRSVYDPTLADPNAICADGRPNENPVTPPKFIKVINNEKNGYTVQIYESDFFKNTKIEGISIVPREE